MRNLFHKQVTWLIIIVVLLVIIFFIGIYIFKNDILNSNKKVIDNQSISLNFVENDAIIIENMLPLSDSVGRNIQSNGDKEGIQRYFDFVVRSKVDEKISYEVYLTKEYVDNEIEPEYIKLYLTEAITDKPFSLYDRNNVPTYFDLKVSDSDPAGRQLYVGSLKNKETKKFRLRMWLSDAYVITAEEKKFVVKVNVKVK